MVSPQINRKRGKSKEMRIRDNKRMNRANAKAAGKIKKPAVRLPGPSKKKIKKNEQRARLQASSTSASSKTVDAMLD